MKLIAFDTACSRDYKDFCEICLFGFVVASENFEIEMSGCTPIRASKPTGRLRKIARVDPEKLAVSPDYRAVRKTISQILSRKDAIYVAHSPENNFRHLCIMDRRYGIAPIKCKAYDVFTLLKNYANIPLYSLSGIANTFGIRFNHSENNYRAKTCVRIMEYICKEEKISLKRFIEVCSKGAVVDSEIINHRIVVKSKQKRMEAFYSNMMAVKNGKFSNMKFAVSESFENENIEVGFRIGEYVTRNGGVMTKRSSEADIFVWDGNIASKRLGSVYSSRQVKVVTPSELFLADSSVFSLDYSR